MKNSGLEAYASYEANLTISSICHHWTRVTHREGRLCFWRLEQADLSQTGVRTQTANSANRALYHAEHEFQEAR